MDPRGIQRGSSVAYVIGTYPLLTTTFVDREIREVRRRGIGVRIVSLRRPRRMLSPEQSALGETVEYVLPVSVGRVVRAHLRWMLRRPGTLLAVTSQLLMAAHPSARARLKTLLHVVEGVVVADVLDGGSRVSHIHAHFVDRAATVAIVASRLLGIGYSATAHANDIYVDPVLLEEKITRATSVVTCTQYNLRHLEAILPDVSNVEVVYHGLDLSRFTGDRHEDDSPTLLSVAQLREKKGLVHLIDAIGVLRDRQVAVRCVIAGEGPLRPVLEARISELDLGHVIELTGAIPHDEVIDLMRRAWLFVLPAVVAADGDRDGIPNVILEALATGLPVVSTQHSGIPEIVVDGVSGALVPPADPMALADVIETLIADPQTRSQLGLRGRTMVTQSFDIVRNAERLIATWPIDTDGHDGDESVPASDDGNES